MSDISRSLIMSSKNGKMITISSNHILLTIGSESTIGIPTYNMPIWHSYPIVGIKEQANILIS